MLSPHYTLSSNVQSLIFHSQSYGLGVPSSHNYLKGNIKDEDILSQKFKDGYVEVVEAFKYMGFESEDVESLHQIIAGIINTGDIEFKQNDNVSGLQRGIRV